MKSSLRDYDYSINGWTITFGYSADSEDIIAYCYNERENKAVQYRLRVVYSNIERNLNRQIVHKKQIESIENFKKFYKGD